MPQTPPRTVDDVFRSGLPALAAISREQGEAKARALLVLLVKDMLDFFNLTETMADRQVAVTVDLIIEEYPYMQADDIALCFRNAMKGKYGKLYNRIDGQVIMGWLREYNRERCTQAEQASYNEAQAHKSELAQPTQGMFYNEYRALLERKAADGDTEAARLLARTDRLAREIRKRTKKRTKNK